MKPRDIFNLAVRLLGLIFLYQGLQAFPSGVVQLCAAIPNMNSGMILPILTMAGWPLLVAYWLLRGAPLIMRTAYTDAVGSNGPETQIERTLKNQADV